MTASRGPAFRWAVRLSAALAAAVVWAPAALAAPPNLTTLEVEAGETEAELLGYSAVTSDGNASSSRFNGELTYGFSDTVGLELQVAGFGQGGETETDEVSLQLIVRTGAWEERGSAGFSIEAGLDPSEDETEVGALAYAVIPIYGLVASGNLGVEVSLPGEETSAVYAATLERRLSNRWSVGLETGGSREFEGDHEIEAYAGPVVSFGLTGANAGPELRVGYLFGFGEETPDLLMAGVALGF